MLSLAEEVLLLALLEKKESIRIPSSLSLPFALSGAVLIELILSGFAKIEDEKLSLLNDAGLVENERLKSVVEKIQKASKPRKMSYWVYQLGMRGNRLSKELLSCLVEQKILTEEGKLYRWGRSGTSETSAVIGTKYLLKRQIRDTVLCEREGPDTHTMALLALLEAGGMLDHVFTIDEIIVARKRIKMLRKDETRNKSFSEVLALTTAAVELAVANAFSV